ncbi:MAG: hypothetical protein U0790_08760 [Isosphaeraceae bacterium]
MIGPSRRRRWLLFTGTLIATGLAVVLLWQPIAWWGSTRARRAWLANRDAEIRRFMAGGRVSPTRPGADDWFDHDFALFDRGWAVWRLNTFHSDPGEGSGWGGVGDIAILIDDQGRAHYSRSHFCDGSLGWALGYPLQPLPPRPADVGSFLALFKPGTWTDDRAAVEAAVPTVSPPR